MRSLTRREATLAGTLTLALLGAFWLKPGPAVETAASLQAGTRNGSGTPGEEPEGSAAPATPSDSAGHAAGAAAAGTTGNDVPKLLLDRAGDGEGISGNLRNLFNYTKSPAEFAAERAEVVRIEQLRLEADKRRREDDERRRKQAEAEAIYRAANPLPPPEPPAPPITMRLIGLIGPARAKLAVLSDGPGGELYVVKAGDIFADKFKLLTLDFESVTVGYVNPKFASIPPRTLRIGG